MSSDDKLRASERPPEALDDELDRGELRDRYYGLLQELRVVLPGVQVLVAFLLTIPSVTYAFLGDYEHDGPFDRMLYTITGLVAIAVPVYLYHRGSEVDDVVTAFDVLKTRYPQVDPSRVGIIGWSHGGMITLLSIFRNPAMFKAAVAMVPVTNLFQRLAWKGVERQHQAIDPQNRYGGLPHERQVPVMQRAHGRHQADAVARATPRRDLLAQRGHPAERDDPSGHRPW